MMPLITRRSSTRGLPRVSLGRCGSIFANCSSVSQNPSRFIAPSTGSVNHETAKLAKPLWVRTLARLDPAQFRSFASGTLDPAIVVDESTQPPGTHMVVASELESGGPLARAFPIEAGQCASNQYQEQA